MKRKQRLEMRAVKNKRDALLKNNFLQSFIYYCFIQLRLIIFFLVIIRKNRLFWDFFIFFTLKKINFETINFYCFLGSSISFTSFHDLIVFILKPYIFYVSLEMLVNKRVYVQMIPTKTIPTKMITT